MEWLLWLACPLMMLICMKGMFTGNKKDNAPQSNHVMQQEMQQMQIKMGEMMEQNHKLMKELESMKPSASNVVELKEESRATYKRISPGTTIRKGNTTFFPFVFHASTSMYIVPAACRKFPVTL
jgi:regulator of replication initiation timing